MLYCQKSDQVNITNLSSGFLLCGDYDTFRSIHKTIHHIVNESISFTHRPFAEYAEFTLGLAYDIRKAYEEQREIIRLKDPQRIVYAVEVCYPYFILQVSLLRSATSTLPSSRRMQANLFLLESIIEESMRLYQDQNIDGAEEILDRLPSYCYYLSSINVNILIQEIIDEWINAPSHRRLHDLAVLLRQLTAPEFLRQYVN